MPYTPPGVYTQVEIANNLVQLPGGQRFLALIGVARNYKEVSGEAYTMTTAYFNTLIHQPIKTVDSVYDFSGQGGSINIYPNTGTDIYGGGWSVSGTGILWSPSANPYPTASTPATGNSYYVTYNYAGSSATGTGAGAFTAAASGILTQSGTASGNWAAPALLIPTVVANIGITNVYSGNDTTGSQYSGTGTGTGGSGWFQSGTTLYFTNGSLTDFTDAAASGTIPASGANYFVLYNYTGTVTSQSFVQNGSYSNPIFTGSQLSLSSGTTSLVSGTITVTGNGINPYPAYPATGTGGGVYSIVDSGWEYVSGTNTIDWNAVNPATYTYVEAPNPNNNSTFFVDYSWSKTGTDYSPKNFTNYIDVVNEYGPEAEWTLGSGNNAGSYVFDHLNPLTLGARLAFQNGASIVTLTQISGNGLAVGDFYNPLDLLQPKIVDVIIPLTVGSGASVVPSELTLAEKAGVLLAVDQHCITMAYPQNKKERVGIGSLGVADIGDTTTPDSYIKVASQELANKRITVIAPGMTSVEIQDPNGTFQTIIVDGAFMAVAMGALSCNPNFDVATPLTNKNLSGFTSTSAVSPNHPNPEYLESEKNMLAAGGVCVVDRNGAKIFIRHQLTTDQTNVANGEFSVVTTTDFVSQAVRFTTEQFIGKKLITGIIVPAVKATIASTMGQLVDAQIINAIGAITVQVNQNNPTELLSTVQYVPVFPLNRIKVTFTIRTQL